MIEDPTTVTVECWSRDTAEPAVGAWQDSVYEQLQNHVNADRITDLEINTWGKCIQCPTAGHDEDETPVDESWEKYRQFEHWASSGGYDLEPGFRRYKRSSLVSSDSCEPVVVPVLCLAVYADTELQAVFPCSTQNQVWTVEDGLALLDPDQSMTWADFATESVREANDASEQEVRRDAST
jgi:hypothetical protein